MITLWLGCSRKTQPLPILMLMILLLTAPELTTHTTRLHYINAHAISHWKLSPSFSRLWPPGNTIHSKLMSQQSLEMSWNIPMNQESTSSSSTKTNLLQWNAAQLSSLKLQELSILAAEIEAHVILLNEVHAVQYPSDPPLLPDFDRPFYTCPDNSKGLVSYVHKSVKWKRMTNTTNQLNNYGNMAIGQAIKIYLSDMQDVLVWNVYLHPNASLSIRREFLRDIIRLSFRFDRVIIAGDMNEKICSYNPSCPSQSSSLAVLEESGILPVNDDRPTRIQLQNNGKHMISCIDGTFVSESLLPRVSGWNPLSRLSSDHLPVLTVLMDDRPQYGRSHLNLPCINWRHAQKIIRQLWSDTHPDSRSNNFISILKDAVQSSSRKPNNPKRTSCPWWDDELETIRKQKNYHRNHGPLQEYQCLKAVQRRLYRKKFRLYFDELAVNMASHANPWRILRILAPKIRKSSKRSVHPDWFTRKTHADQLAREYQSIFSCIDAYSYPVKPICQELHISSREITATIANANHNSACGPDGIGYATLARLRQDPEVSRIMDKAINVWVQQGFPSDAKIAKIVPLPKGSDPSLGYRPISLLNCLPKIVERIICNRLRHFIEPLLNPAQAGCRAMHEVSHCVIRLMHASTSANRVGLKFGSIFLDFSKAYDRIDHSRLLMKLEQQFNVSPNLVNCVSSWLSQRSFFVQIEEVCSPTYFMNNGIPQGSSLSVLLWQAYVNDIPIDVSSSSVFMDDTCFWASAPNVLHLEIKLRARLRLIEIWCQENNIMLNTRKTKLLLNHYQTLPAPKLGSSRLTPSRTTKYLGYHLFSSIHARFSLQFDLQPLARDIQRRNILLRRLRYRLPTRSFRLFGEGLIKSKLRFYLPLLSSEHSDTLRPVRTAYNEYVRSLCGGIRSTPLPLLFSQSGLPPLEQLIADESRRFYFRIMSNGSSLLCREFESWSGLHHQGSPMLGILRTELSVPAHLKDHSFEQRIRPSMSAMESLSAVNFSIRPTRDAAIKDRDDGKLFPTTDYYAATDGSFYPESKSGPARAGAGFLIENFDAERLSCGSFRVEPACSSYHSEIQALWVCLENCIECLSQSLYRRSLTVMSDSRSLLTHLQAAAQSLQPLLDSTTVEIIDFIHVITLLGAKIHMVWVPGHIGIDANETADDLAKYGASRKDEFRIESTLPLSQAKLWCKKVAEGAFEALLRQEIKPSKVMPQAPSRKRFLTPRSNPTEEQGLSRRTEVMYFRLLTGHTNTYTHWNNLGVNVETTKCRFCKVHEDSAEHILLHCPLIWKSRPKLLDMMEERGLSFWEMIDSSEPLLKTILLEHIHDLSVLKGVVL